MWSSRMFELSDFFLHKKLYKINLSKVYLFFMRNQLYFLKLKYIEFYNKYVSWKNKLILMTKWKSRTSPEEKTKLPDEWKALFLWIESTGRVEEFVKCLVQKVLKLDDDKKESFYANYKKSEFQEKVRRIFTEEKYGQIDYVLSARIMKPFYYKLGVRNLTYFLKKLQSQSTSPQ